MADGNMGDISFSLTLKSRVEEETRKVIKSLNSVDETGKRAQQALEAIAEATKGVGRGGNSLEKFNSVLKSVIGDIAYFSKEEFFDPKKVRQLNVVSEGLAKIETIIQEISNKGTGFSIFPNGTAKVLSEAEKAYGKLAALRREFTNWEGKGLDVLGVGATNNIRQANAALSRFQTILDQIRNNGGLHPSTGKTANDIINSTYFTQTLNNAKSYAKEIKDAIKDVETARKANEAVAANEYARQKRQQEIAKAERDTELKAMSDYAKRYMELQEAKAKADEKRTAQAKKESEQRVAQIEKDTRKMSELYSILGVAKDKAEKVGMNGLALNVDTSKLEAKLKVAEDLMNRIFNENVKTLGMGGRPSSDDYATNVRNVKRVLDEATQSQKELNRAQEQANKTAKREEEKRLAQETRDAAKAAREAAQAEKQRQREMEVSRQRIQSMERALHNLQEKRFTTKMLGLDTSDADAKIDHLKTQLIGLRNILNGLSMGDTSFLGRLGNIGNGREVQSANNLASIYDKVNKEAQKGIEIEQKRQQEIAKSAAKVQADLVRGFERANSHAGKLNSTVRDLKSLFLQGGLVFGAQQFAMNIITIGGEMEKQHIALQSILGDMQNANTMFNQTKELALNSPFTFSELNRDVKQLAAYGVEYDQLYDTTKRLADMSSGLGVSFDRIALAFGQVQARGWLDGKELRQIAYAGIPLLSKLSEFYSKREGKNVSTSEIKTRISNREVSFDDVKSIFWQMTSEGGQFYNMQQTLSETLLGRYNKLKDAWEIMLADFADGKSVIGGTFKFILDQVTELVQLMHTFSPMVLGAFSGVALKKMGTLLAGSAASNFLTNKEKIAQDIKARALSGQQLSVTEQRILATKKLITREDLQTLIAAKAITKTELQRLYLSGKISKEMYKQAVTQAGMNGFWTNFANKGGVAISLLGKGLGSMMSSLWAMIGGLPGLIITAVTMGVGYAISKYQELSRSIEQTQSELVDRLKQIREFRADNAGNMAKALADGDTKGIDNLIDAYKEKLKELAPYNFNNLVMKAEEKQSHEDRLRYLDQELQKLQEAEKLAKSKLNNRSNYGDLKDAIDYANQFYDNKDKLTYKYISDGVDKNEARKKAFSVDKYADFNANQIKREIQEIFGDISKDETLRLAAEQAMSSIFSALGVPDDRANEIRASVLQAFGIGDKDSWLQGEVRSKMQALIDDTFPEIGAKIRASIPLTKAEQDKVKELMDDAKQGLIRQYPELENTLQRLLASSNFQAVIKLVFASDDKFNDMTSELIGRIPAMLDGDVAAKYRGFAKKWGKDNSYYSGRNLAKSDIDAAYNEYQSASKSKSKDADKKRNEWLLLKDAAKALLYYDYTGEGKKSNKPGKKNNGRQEDKELKALQERLSSFKSARQEYQKFKNVMSESDTKNLVYDLFPNVKGLNLDDYIGSVNKITPSDAWFKKSSERLKLQTSLKKEIADWKYSEYLKPEFDRISADFTEALEKGASQFDLYKTLLEKTGDKSFAMQAFGDGAIWSEQAQQLAKEFKEMTGLDVDLNATDATAKHYLVDVKGNQRAYELWKKIVALVKGDFTEALKTQADLIEKALDYEEQITKIEDKYKIIIDNANKTGNTRAAAIARQQKREEIGSVNLKKFKNSEDYLNFYGAIYTLGAKKANEIAMKIRENLNKALADGSISAREYGKEIENLQSQLDKLSKVQPSFLNGGLNGIVQSMQNRGQSQMTAGQNKYDYYKKLSDLAEQKGNLSDWLSAQDGMEAGQVMSQGGEQLMQGASEMQGTISMIDTIIHGINDLVQGLNDTFQDIKETAEALGTDTSTDDWEDYNTFFSSFSSASNSATKGWDSLKEGNIGGVISGVVGSWTGWIKGFAQGHDKKLDNQIKIAERSEKLLSNIYDNTKSVVDKTLGGIYNYKATDYTTNGLNTVASDYERRKALEAELNGTSSDAWKYAAGGSAIGSAIGSSAGPVGAIIGGVAGTLVGGIVGLFSNRKKKLQKQINSITDYGDDTYKQTRKAIQSGTAYDTELATMLAQRDTIKQQRNAEASKKNSDEDKLADYDKQIEDIRLKIETFAQDFLKDIYSIDMKSWASELTDAVVGAWEKGEDAVDAYREKVKDMVKDVTKNIVTQKIMEQALSAPLKYLTGILEEKGQLDETDMDKLAEMLYSVGDTVVPQITGIFDALKNRGWDFRENGSSSTTNSIKSITEETADLLASYLNSIRLDVSVNREQIKLISDAVKNVPELSVIARSQLTAMNQLVTLAEYRNGVLDNMYSWMKSVTSGTGTKSIKIN